MNSRNESVGCTALARKDPAGLMGKDGSTIDIDDNVGRPDWRGDGLGRFVCCLDFFTSRSLLLVELRPLWCVRRCCSMLSLRVKALLHSGQYASFLPVCFLAWRAAWPDVVK